MGGLVQVQQQPGRLYGMTLDGERNIKEHQKKHPLHCPACPAWLTGERSRPLSIV